jgi:hypothetical protein
VLAVLGAACGGGGGGDPDAGSGDGGGPGIDALVCGAGCDEDGDGVRNEDDLCPDTSAIGIVNSDGCNDAQVDPTLTEEEFPPFGLTWTPDGDAGRAGGLNWVYTGIQRMGHFHIYWMVCDDPALPCALSMNGAIDASEHYTYSAGDSDPAGGVLVLTNATEITRFDASVVPLTGRWTVRIVDAADAPLPFEDAAALGATLRTATHGAEIPGVGFKVNLLGEVNDGAGWVPYSDYFDSVQKPDPFEPFTVSFIGVFYDE